VHTFGGAQSPVLVTQSQCDRPEDERDPPLPPGALDGFAYKRVLHYSAKGDGTRPRGHAALVETLLDGGEAGIAADPRNQRAHEAGRQKGECQHRLGIGTCLAPHQLQPLLRLVIGTRRQQIGRDVLRLMSRFVSETANVLELVQDALRPRLFDDYVNHVFD
jgi:hypothetical protein